MAAKDVIDYLVRKNYAVSSRAIDAFTEKTNFSALEALLEYGIIAHVAFRGYYLKEPKRWQNANSFNSLMYTPTESTALEAGS
jgi:hypothetical protein